MENNSKNNKIIIRKKGLVVSDKMNKTVVVAIDTYKTHSKYKKKYKSTKRYKAHDENNKFKIGDVVVIEPIKPISKDKKYKVVDNLK